MPKRIAARRLNARKVPTRGLSVAGLPQMSTKSVPGPANVARRDAERATEQAVEGRQAVEATRECHVGNRTLAIRAEAACGPRQA